VHGLARLPGLQAVRGEVSGCRLGQAKVSIFHSYHGNYCHAAKVTIRSRRMIPVSASTAADDLASYQRIKDEDPAGRTTRGERRIRASVTRLWAVLPCGPYFCDTGGAA